MTGFGKGHISKGGRHARAEVKTLNHRFLDIGIRASRILAPFEERMRDEIRSRIARGHVEVSVTFASNDTSGYTTVLDVPQIELLARAAEQISSVAGCSNGLTAAQILQTSDIVAFVPSDEEAEIAGRMALEAVRKACDEVTAARTAEGAALWDDIQKRAAVLGNIVEEISAREPYVVREYAQRLAARVKDLTADVTVDKARIAQEVAIFADKCNVTEEVVRLQSHLKRLSASGQSDAPQGRNLDFLVQEINREFNTIGSKSQDTILTNCVLDAKAEVEKIREQIQNIE